MSAPFTLDDLGNDDPDVVTAEFYVRSMHNHGWSESVIVAKNVETARGKQYATVTRTYHPNWDLEDFEETRISVVPRESEHGRSARCTTTEDVVTNIVIAKKKPNGGMDVLDRLADEVKLLSKEIVDWFECNPHFRQTCSPCQLNGRWRSATRPQIYDIADTNMKHLFATSMQFRALCMQNLCCCKD